MGIADTVTTGVLVQAVYDGTTRIGMAKLCAMAIKAENDIDWKKVDRAILARWANSGLVFIKRRTSGILDGTEFF